MNFKELNINPLILKKIEEIGFEELTEIQESVIPLAVLGKDLIGQAPTGTGKTLAFAIPILDYVNPNKKFVQAVVIAPTRELVVQITNEINEFGEYFLRKKAVAIYGGESIEKQFVALRKHPMIIVATPGRLLDHIERGSIDLSNVGLVTLDEADEMLNMGFKDDIDSVLGKITMNHQTLLFSATFSPEIEKIAKDYMVDATKIRTQQKSLTVSQINQFYIDVNEKNKLEVISRVIELNEYKLAMIFCNTKKAVDEVTSGLLVKGILAEALHGDMKQLQRDRVMNRFRNGTLNVLVASDVAARGLDVDDVEVVFNYDFPSDEEYYVHRIGRTGRAKKVGVAISLVSSKEKFLLRRTEKYAKVKLDKMSIPSMESVVKSKTRRILENAIESSSKQGPYDDIILKRLSSINNVDKDLIIKGLINLIIDVKDVTPEAEEILEEIKSRKTRYANNDIRCFINLGKKDNIKVYNLTDLLCEKTSLSNAEINAVKLLDNFSFFEIPKEYIDDVLSLNDSLVYNGKSVIIEIAKSKGKSEEAKESKSKSSKDKKSSNKKPKGKKNISKKTSNKPNIKKIKKSENKKNKRNNK